MKIDLVKFSAKNAGVKNIYGGSEVAAAQSVTLESDKGIAKRQIRAYEEVKNYIEKIVDNDQIIQDVLTVNNMRLANYTIKFDTTGKYIHVVDKTTGFVYGVYSLGNAKLVSAENTQFLIFNVLQRIACINKTKECMKFCYANKSNLNVNAKNSNSRNSRVNNLVFSMFENFDEITSEVIEFVKEYTNRQILFRFHEAGDIYSQTYWNKIKNVIHNNTDVNFMFYTRTAFILNEINEINKLPHVSLRYSLDNSTHENIVSKCDKMNCLTFIVLDKKDTCKAVDIVGNTNMCNVKKIDITNQLEEIKALEKELETETRKTYKDKIQTKINAINNSLINKNVTCTKCMKCFNKNKVSLFVATH